MSPLFKRLVAPLMLKVDFTDRYWNISRRQARGWVLAAVGVDLTVQWFVGAPTALTVLASLLTIVVFWAAPARLAGAAGGLYIGQALVSVLLVRLAALSGSALLVAGAAYLWSAWCLLALAVLVLRYIRTPKASM